MFKILIELWDFVQKGMEAYASTDEGRKELEDIYQAIENVGIDLPFFDGEEQSDVIDFNSKEGSGTDYVNRFMEKHPELFNRKGVKKP